MGARCPLSDDERADVWQVLRQIRQHAIRAVGLLSDSDTARAALVAKIDVMLIELGLLRDRLRAADHLDDVGLRHCPGLQVPKSVADRLGWATVPACGLVDAREPEKCNGTELSRGGPPGALRRDGRAAGRWTGRPR
jgi:hypothetical protein